MIIPGQGDYCKPDFITTRGDTSILGYEPDVITDLTLNWLRNSCDEEKPFLLFLPAQSATPGVVPIPRNYQAFTKKTFTEPVILFDNYSGSGTAAKETEMNLLK